MKSFAAKDITYSDGQRNREPIPAEIQESGFKPPVKLPDGLIELGDFLAANHLNTIFNDLYSQISASPQVVEKGGSSTTGYRVFANGDIEQWGVGTPNASGDATITFTKTLPGSTNDISITQRAAAGSSDLHQTMIVGSVTTTGFVTRSRFIAAAGGATAVSQNSFFWKVYYHA